MSDSGTDDRRRTTFAGSATDATRGMSDQLTPTAPAEAVEWYLSHREPDLAESTLHNHAYRLNRFLEWCEEAEIEDLSELSGRDLHRFRVYRSERVKPVSLKSELQTLRVFLEFCAAVEAVPDGLRERVQIPSVSKEQETREELLGVDRAETLIQNLERYRYASREHVIVAVLWHTGIRLGTLLALDVDDLDLEDGHMQIRHRPETDTPLKNGEAAERMLAVDDRYCRIIRDYIDTNRIAVTDEYGRRPLLTTDHGRMVQTTVRSIVYSATQPCQFDACPHDEDPQTCEYRKRNHRGGCPSSRSPHCIRRGAITHHLRTGVPLEVVSDRTNASREVLDQHYDKRTEYERMEQRREFLDDIELQTGSDDE